MKFFVAAAMLALAAAVPTLRLSESDTDDCTLQKVGNEVVSSCDVKFGTSTFTSLKTKLDALHDLVHDPVQGLANAHSKIDDNTWQLVRDNNGATLANNAYWAAVCSQYNGWGADFVFKVEMGTYTDYYRAASTSDTFCDVVQSYTKHQWSPTGDANDWHAIAHYGGHLGGSKAGWPAANIAGDSRNYVAFWGDQGTTGGCCYDGTQNAWNLPFTLSIKHVAYDTAVPTEYWHDVASPAGTTVANSAYWASVCSKFDYMGSDFVFEVTMGSYTDYFRATSPDMTFCEVVQSYTKHQWSPSGNAGDWHAMPHYGGHLGGCKAGWPAANIAGDSRNYVSFWGDQSTTGGCCYDGTQNAWNLGLSMRIKHVPYDQAYPQQYYEQVMTTDGQSVLNNAYWAGVCSQYNDLGSDFVFKVEMGTYTDYFRAANAGDTFCDVVQSYTKHQWSPSGDAGSWISFAYYGGHLGGSQAGWPAANIAGDSRNYFSFWGDQSTTGGCCYDGSVNAWHLGFTMSIKPEPYVAL